jgi:uncharacterized protein (TIGR02466 family)
MNKIPIFTVPFYEFTSDDQLTNDVLGIAKDQQYRPNATNKTSITRLKYQPLMHWIETCLDELKTDLYNEATFDLKITNCWINKSSYTEKHHAHSHGNSLYSGIYYLTTHEKKATTKFYLPNPFYTIDLNNLFGSKDLEVSVKTSIVSEVSPVAGKLLIFPSQLIHETTTNITKDNRYTVSFNTFVSGIVGSDNYLTKLHIDTRYLDEE